MFFGFSKRTNNEKTNITTSVYRLTKGKLHLSTSDTAEVLVFHGNMDHLLGVLQVFLPSRLGHWLKKKKRLCHVFTRLKTRHHIPIVDLQVIHVFVTRYSGQVEIYLGFFKCVVTVFSLFLQRPVWSWASSRRFQNRQGQNPHSNRRSFKGIGHSWCHVSSLSLQ